MKRYRKKAKLAMIATLAISSLSSGINHVFAQVENINTQESQIEKEAIVEELEVKENLQDEKITTGDIAIDLTNFPDSEFQSYIRANLDSNKDLILSSDELNKVTKIDLSNYLYRGGIKSVEGIEHFPNLRILRCDETSITSIDISKNLALEELNLSKTNVINLDASKNLALRWITAADSEITNIDVSNNPALTNLILWSAKNITSLDVTNCPSLYQLDFNGTSITSIDVSQNPKLYSMNCRGTKISSLDISNNPLFTTLRIDDDNNFTWLNIGNNENLSIITYGDDALNNNKIDLGHIGGSFNIATVTEAFKGIDISKVTMVSGATYDSATGEVSGYRNGTPIVYRYDSGTMQNGEAVSLTVTLNFTKDLSASTIHINNYEGKEYDGTAVSNPEYSTTGSSGEVTFEWFTKGENGQWVSLGDQAPINAGAYGVKAYLAADANYEAADSGEPTPFEITKAPSTIEILGDLNKTYDGEAVKEPSIKIEGSSETATFEWFKKEDDGVTRAITWTSLTTTPKEIGEYKVVVKVAEDENYLSAEVEKEFAITEKAEVPSIPEEDKDNITTEEKVEGVQTGDVTQTSMWTMLVGLSMSMMYFFIRKQKNR